MSFKDYFVRDINGMWKIAVGSWSSDPSLFTVLFYGTLSLFLLGFITGSLLYGGFHLAKYLFN